MTHDASRPAAAPHQDDAYGALVAEVDAELAAERDRRRSRRRASDRVTGVVLLLGSAIAWVSALTLLVDKLRLLTHPGTTLGCDINPFISCGSVMSTWQASAFGFPNMALGLGGYAIMGAAGALLASRALLPRWYRWAVLGGIGFAFGFLHFLAVSAIFVIRALCPWCMVVWAVTAPMFFATLAHAVEDGDLRPGRVLAAALRHWVWLTLAWYALVIATIALAFWHQWMAVLGL